MAAEAEGCDLLVAWRRGREKEQKRDKKKGKEMVIKI